MTTSTISVHDVTRTYGQRDLAVVAVRHIDLDVDPGEVVLI
jgi:ABC-type glutathione transport system ATPase component